MIIKRTEAVTVSFFYKKEQEARKEIGDDSSPPPPSRLILRRSASIFTHSSRNRHVSRDPACRIERETHLHDFCAATLD